MRKLLLGALRRHYRIAVGALLFIALLLSSAIVLERVAQKKEESLLRDETFATVDGRRVRYRLTGAAGQGHGTIILLNGMNASFEQWNRVQLLLSESTRVLSYDRGGMGFSDPLPAAPNVFEAQSRELLGLAKSLQLERPYLVVAYSSAGSLGRTLVENHREGIDGVFFLDPYLPEGLRGEGRFAVVKHSLRLTNWAIQDYLKALTGYARAKASPSLAEDDLIGLTEKQRALRRAALFRESHRRSCFALRPEWEDHPTPAIVDGRWGPFPVFVFSTELEGRSSELKRRLAAQSTRSTFEASPLSHLELTTTQAGVVAQRLRQAQDALRPSSEAPFFPLHSDSGKVNE